MTPVTHMPGYQPSLVPGYFLSAERDPPGGTGGPGGGSAGGGHRPGGKPTKKGGAKKATAK